MLIAVGELCDAITSVFGVHCRCSELLNGSMVKPTFSSLWKLALMLLGRSTLKVDTKSKKVFTYTSGRQKRHPTVLAFFLYKQ